MMTDTVRGTVTNVIDGDTFDMHVTHTGTNNQNTYNNNERIRIDEINTPELPSSAGKRAKNDLDKAIGGKEVRCYIQARDSFGRLVCKVTIV